MAHTYEYAVLTAIPDPRRGERVNVGIAVFRGDRVDVRFKQAIYKLRALTGDNWEPRIESAQSRYEALFDADETPAELLRRFEMAEPLLRPSGTGWLTADSEAQYEDRVREILQALVMLPRRERGPTKSRINTEMAREFKRAKILATGDETIEDGKVVRDFSIDEKEGLVADFALKNGKMHVATALDLRKQSAGLGEAALKSIVLDKADKKYSGNVNRIGVYAVDSDMIENFRDHIELLGDYADQLYNWEDRDSRNQLQRAIYDAISHVEGGLI